jgi:alkylmercury lyase
MTTHPNLESFASSLVGTFPGGEDAPLARALLAELAKGQPVSPAALATRAGRDETEVSDALARWPNVHLDEQQRVVAFGGLSVIPAAHGFTVAGQQLYTWCAWDTLFLPALLGQPADAQSGCPVSGAEVRLRVAPDGVRAAEPEQLWVSFPQPGSASTADITGSFCCHVHFLAGRAAAERWSNEHPGAVVLTLDDAFELGRLATEPLRGDAVPGAA